MKFSCTGKLIGLEMGPLEILIFRLKKKSLVLLWTVNGTNIGGIQF